MLKQLGALILLCVVMQTASAQPFLPVCKNFTSQDYNDDAEFRCAATDYKGTLYFGSNYGIFIYKGEKRSSGKNWRTLLLPQPDVIYSLYMDTAARRLYVGGQHGFGYFQLSSYDKGDYISLNEKPKRSKGEVEKFDEQGFPLQPETWHIEKIGSKIVFHTLARLLIHDGQKTQSIPAPDAGIFHNIFKISDEALLVNSLDMGWWIYRNNKKTAAAFKLPPDKCYSVLASRENTYLFFFRNEGVWKITDPTGNKPTATKISDPSFDKILREKQVYCAALSADSSRFIVGTLNEGTLLVHYTEKLTGESVLSEMQTTGILNTYGLFTDPQKNTWILGKSNLSRLPADLTLVNKDFRGVTVKSLLAKSGSLFVAASNGLFKLSAANALFSGNEKLTDGNFNKLLFHNDTLIASTSGYLVLVTGKKITNLPAPTPINDIALVENTLWISTWKGLYCSARALLNDQALLKEKNVLQSIQVNEKIYLLIDGEGILQCNSKGEKIRDYKLNEAFPSTQNAKLFAGKEGLLISNLNGTFKLEGKNIAPVSQTMLWLYKAGSKGQFMKFEFDRENYPYLAVTEKNKNEFKKVNAFMSSVEVNDIESDLGYYYLGTKTGLYVSRLWSDVEESAQVFRVQAGSQSYYPDKPIRIPYNDSRMDTVYCGLNSFFDSYTNTTYKYRLLGSDDEGWYAQPGSELIFRGLPWGDYTLELQVVYGNQLETPVTQLAFTILKPWYATWWAILLWIAIFLLFIYAVVQISVYRLKQSKIKLEKIVEERTAEVVHQKNEIEAQKEEIESKNHEITDSINYAQRIQNSLLKDEKKLRSHLPGSFILYLPKDIVSGDFYWFADIGEYTVLAVADCTGHGVPGAFMSMLGVAKLNELAAKNISRPDVLLHELNHLIVETLGQNVANSESRDGMDVALIAIHKKNKKLFYAGANRPLYIVNTAQKTLEEIKPTKLPVGGGQYGENRNYQLHELVITDELCFYLSTDGYADQFGGPKGKKMMSKRMQELLVEIATLPPETQKDKLQRHYLEWRGRLEQVDDVCVAGLIFRS